MTHHPAIPATALPQAAQKITLVCASEEYDDFFVHLEVARDWKSRGEKYLRSAGDLDDDCRILMTIPGHAENTFGCAIRQE